MFVYAKRTNLLFEAVTPDFRPGEFSRPNNFDARQPEVNFLHFWAMVFANTFN